mgnify:CR=1 FL=1
MPTLTPARRRFLGLACAVVGHRVVIPLQPPSYAASGFPIATDRLCARCAYRYRLTPAGRAAVAREGE